MKMSSFQIILLSVFGAFAVAGILIFAFLVGSNSGSTIGPVTIWGPFDDVAVQTIIRQLSDEDSRLRQVTYVKKNPETFEQELTNAIASGSGPDLYVLRQDYAVVDTAKIAAIPYASFSREQFQSMFVEAANPFLAEDGVLAVPLTVDPYILFWNRDLLGSAGFAKPPVYWDEVFDMARTITDCQQLNANKGNTVIGCDESRSIQKATIAFGEYQNVDHAKDIISLLILQAGGPITARDGAGNLAPSLMVRSSDIAQPAESALMFYTTFANPARDAYSWNRSLPKSREAFGSGDLALYVGLASEYSLIKKLNPNLNFAVAPIPQLRNLQKSTNTGLAYGFAIPRAFKVRPGQTAAQRYEELKTAAYLLASPAASKAIATVTGMSSARRDVIAQGAQGNDDLFNRQTLIARTWEDPNPVETSRIFRDMIESIVSGSAKITEALQRAEQAMRQLTQQ